MEKDYNENCKAQALTIKWICRMLEEYQVRQYLKIIDFYHYYSHLICDIFGEKSPAREVTVKLWYQIVVSLKIIWKRRLYVFGGVLFRKSVLGSDRWCAG